MAPGPSSITTSDNLWCLSGSFSSESALPAGVLVESLKCQHCFRCTKLQFPQGCFSQDELSVQRVGRPPCLEGLLRHPPTALSKINPECASSLNLIAPRPMASPYSWLIHDTYNGKEKAATATRAFWLPFAYRHSGDYSEAELRDPAQQSIWQMEAQIQHLREEFDLGASSAQHYRIGGSNQFGAFTDRVRHCTGTACDGCGFS